MILIALMLIGTLSGSDTFDWNTLSGSDTLSNLLCDLIFDHQLIQCIDSPTHKRGNILNLVITKSDHQVCNINVVNNILPSDHYVINFSITLFSSFSCPQDSPPSYFLNYKKPIIATCVTFYLNGISESATNHQTSK